MYNNQYLGAFGYGQTFLGDIKLTTDSDGNVTILNSGIQSLLPQQLSGTALYESNAYNLNTQQLLSQSSKRSFSLQTDGSYTGTDKDKGTLTLVGNTYQLKEKNGTVIVFRADGQLDYIEDTNGYRITAAYTNNQLTKLTASDGDSFNLTYNPQGRISTITDSSGQTTTYTYDTTGQSLLSVQDSKGTTSFTYSNPYDPSLVTGVTYADGTKLTYDYDEYGRIQQIIQGEGRQALAYTYTYDASGGYAFTDPSGATTTVAYNETTNTKTVTDPLGRTLQYTYDAAGMLDTITGADGFKIDYNFCGCGQLRSLVDPLGNQVSFNYEPNFGNIQSFTDARGNDVIYGYDTKGNLTSITYEDGSQQTYSYNLQGQLTQSSNRRGQSIGYEYNSQYQITKETHSNGSIVIYGYESNSNLLRYITDSKGTTQINYDQASNKITIIVPNGYYHSYTFDALGRKTQIVTGDATNTRTINYTYDAFSRLDKLTDGTGNLIIDYTYDAIGRLQREDNGNGTYSIYTYDAASQITSLVNYAGNGTINSRFDYTYNNMGRRTSMTVLEGKWDYTYDASGQLTRAVFTSNNPSTNPNQDLTYVYDAAGNRIQTIENGATENYTTNNLNQYTQSGLSTYTYDADGNLITRISGTSTWTYSYDNQNRLIQVIDNNNNKTQYEYDVFGNRSTTIYNGVRTDYLVDPFGMGNVIAEYNNSGQLVANYTHGIGLVGRTNNTNVTNYYDFDANGSTVGMTGSTGSVVNRYSYRPFGGEFEETETVANSFEYVGQWGVMEETNGLDFMRSRFYDSKMGRFVSMDTIGLQGGDTNFYRYVSNNPVSFVDPEGTIAQLLLTIVVGAGAGIGTGLLLGCLGGENGKAIGKSLQFASTLAGLITKNPGVFAYGAGIAFGIDICNNADDFVIVPPSKFAIDANNAFNQAQQIASPLVLDLDGDGIELTALNSPVVRFDIDGDGFREATGWVKPDDGLLVFDRNNDGYINDNSELFGNNNSFSNGFEALKTLDSNGDRVFDAADTNFAKLQVWRDLDTDGRTDVNELFTLNELNIKSINLNYSNVNIDNAGNQIKQTASYELTNGTQRQIVDAWFTIDQLNSRYDFLSTFNSPVIFSKEILDLPNLRGYGNLADLQIAMTKDTQLLSLVKSFHNQATSGDLLGASELIRSILFRWASVDGVDPTSRGVSVNAQGLGFLEKFLGRYFNNQATSQPFTAQANFLTVAYTNLASDLSARLIAQFSSNSVQYDSKSDRLTFAAGIAAAQTRLNQVYIESSLAPSVKLEVEKFLLTKFIGENNTITDGSIVGDLASNQITGTSQNDLIYGFSGNDTLMGQKFNDTLDGGTGIDYLYGGSGDDTYRFNRNDGIDLITDISEFGNTYSGGYVDTLVFGTGITRADLSWYFDGTNLTFKIVGSPNDSITIQNMFDANYQIENYRVADTSISLSEIMTTQVWKDESDRNNLSWFSSAIYFDGRVGDDVITTGNYADKLFGGDGNDLVNGGYGNDTIIGGIDNDTLIGSGDNDSLDGGVGNDSIDGGYDNDTIIGEDGNDYLEGNYGNDRLEGNAGDDTLIGGDNTYYSYNDTLIGGAGNDFLNGNSGNDIYIFNFGDGSDSIRDEYNYLGVQSGGNDTLNFGTGISRSNLSWNFNGIDLIFSLTNSTDTLTIQNMVDVKYRIENITDAGNTLSLSEVMTSQVWQDLAELNALNWLTSAIFFNGGIGNDVINTGSYADRLLGGDGTDTIAASDGADTIDGGADNDYLDAGYGNDSVIGGIGNDTLIGSGNNDSLDGGAGSDSIDGGYDNDTIIGGDGNDYLEGNYGDDRLEGNAGDDTLIGGDNTYYSYNDTLIGGAGNDFLNGNSGNDIYIFNFGDGSDSIRDEYNYLGVQSGGNDTLNFGTGITRTNLRWNFDSKDLNFTLTNSTTDKLTIQNFIDSKYRIENMTVAGTFLGLSEIMSSKINKDVNGLNSLTWGETAISFDGYLGDDNITAGNYADKLYGGDGNDTINANGGNDLLNGGNGNDSLNGSFGIDTLTGNAGIDTLNGGEDNDLLNGGAGNDILTGGSGLDLFIFDTNAAFTTSSVGVDRITDFISGTDKILLDKTTFTSLASSAGNGFSLINEFTIVGSDAAAATAGAFIVYSSATGNLFYNQNGVTTGLGTGAQFATLSNVPSLSANDFILQA